ncbi:MAG: FecR domain-containing protein [Opitutaceae bacterium]|nr:FecR domain-containing protein [Opitutaceae bacterium]
MKRPEPYSPEAECRSQAAADWLARRDRGLTAAEQDEFLQWLAADPRHGEWLALHRRTVGDFAALARWRPEHSAEPNPDLLAPPRRRIQWLAPSLLAAAAALALAAVWWRSAPATPNPAPSAAAPELKRLILEDGSSVELNHGAVVTTEFSATARRATLVRGEALFTVAKNPARPFIVRAGGVDVRAVGTAFSVRLDSAAVEVLVTEGRVAVDHTVPSSRVSAPQIPAAIVDAGHRATVPLTAATPPQIVAVSPQVIAQHLNWQPTLLDFSSAPLAAAVAEFNRRNRVQFVIADAELAALPIVASIRSDNVEGFAQFLALAPGVEVDRRAPTEIVVRRKR